MAKEDILNERQGYDPDLGFSSNPDFGYIRKDPQRTAWKKPMGGVPESRDVMNDGYSFALQWTGRPYACIQRVKRFYNQFKRGVFTFIDWEGGGRHYVGRISQIGDETRVRNNVFSLAGVVFTEIPTMAMSEYPQDWDNDGAWLHPVNGFGNLDAALSGTWTQTARTVGDQNFTTVDSDGTHTGDWAQYEYVGYGFQLSMMLGPALGKAGVYLDGTLLATVDLYAVGLQGPQIVLTKADVPLDFHRVKVVITNTKNGASTGYGAIWHALQVIQ